MYDIGMAVAVVGVIWLLILAFKQSVWWGLGSLIPGVIVVFGLLHLEITKRPFIIFSVGVVLAFLGGPSE